MSNSAYNKIWVDAQEALGHLLNQEIPTRPSYPEKDHLFAFQTLGIFYVKYVQIFRNLESAYDQIVHPQKRRVIRQVLDGVMGRILELKHEMVELELSEFQYFDDILQDFKLNPEDLEIPIPKYFLKEKMKVLKEREKILAEILSTTGFQMTDLKEAYKPMSIDEATRKIQIAERARQGRLRASFMKEIYLEEQRVKRARHLGEVTIDPEVAATSIQKCWRGYIQRKRTKREREEELIFLGMMPPPHFQKVSAAQQQVKIIDALRCKIQEDHETEYQQALAQIKDKLKEIEGPDIKGSLQDEIRQWFIECRHATGKFPEFPNKKQGGSIILFAQKTPEQVVAELAAKEEEKAKKKREKKKPKKPKIKKKERTKDKGKKKGKAEEEDQGWKMAPSQFLQEISGGNQTYRDIWQYRDESWNFPQRHDPELVKEEKRKEVEEEIREQVDELMRQELKNLKMVVDRQKRKKPKRKKKGGKKKKRKTKRKMRKKKKKDLTADRTIDSLYKELVEEGLLIRPKKVYLSDYIGEYNYLGATMRQMDLEPMPSLSDVQQLIVLYGVLPLGSEAVHEKAPSVKSLLLAGPAGVGKKMLVHALCTETGANLFNLSAANIAGKFPGKKGLRLMLHMVLKVARWLQPSVLWIGEAEKTFYKKVPKADKQIKPQRLKRKLPKMLKSFKPADRILIVGTSKCPFNADLKSLCRIYKKIILVPRPDYASRLVLWRHIILQNGGTITNSLNLSCLAKVTDGFTQAHIIHAVQTTLNERRIQQLYRKPLTANEFIGPLATQVPVYREEEEAFKAWYAKTPLGKRRQQALKGEEPDNQKVKNKAKDKGKVKVKKKEKGKKGKKKKT